MPRFDIREIEEVSGNRVRIYKLFKDGQCEFDEFCMEIRKDGNLKAQLAVIQNRLEDVANMRLLPVAKFRDITPLKSSVKEYEVKTHDLRVYLFHEELKGKIIACAGKKSTQKKDIKRFRRIIHEYFESQS
ncbi:MAG: hypothetical protein SF052_10390 [Bacteroidia bacterium]|nr:hypothetical protein [Bacteroidia bacterium]